MKSKDRMISAGPVVNLSPTLVLPDNNKGEVGQENPSDMFIMENLEISLTNPVDKTSGNSRGGHCGEFNQT